MSKLLATILVSFMFCESSFAKGASFDPAILEQKAEQAKALIRSQEAKDQELLQWGRLIVKENKRAASEGRPTTPMPKEIQDAQERAKYDKSTCMGDAPADRLYDYLKNVCNASDIEISCRPNKENILSDSKAANYKAYGMMKGSNPSTVLTALHEARQELIVKLKKHVVSFKNCANLVETQLLAPDCMETYHRVFNDSMNDLISKSCTEESIDFQVQLFAGAMTKPGGFVQTIERIKKDHVAGRKQAAGMAQVLYEIDQQIKVLEDRLPMSAAAQQDDGS